MGDTQLIYRSHDGCNDISYFALRMGITFPVFVSNEVQSKFINRSALPDRETFIILEAAISALDAELEKDEPMAPFIAFDFEHKPKGFRPLQQLLRVHMYADDKGFPWLLISSELPPAVSAASPTSNSAPNEPT